MSYRGDIRLGDTIDIKFTSRRFSTGAPFTLAGSPVISAYVGNGTTEITAGITLTADFDGRTGLNNVRVVASSGNGFATATNVQLVITTGTVDSISVVGEVVAEFSIENRSALMPTTAGRTLDVSAGGEGGVDWANVGSPATTLNLSGTTVKTATDVETDTQDIQTRVPAALISGRIDASTGAMAAGVITAASIAADAITDAKVAADVTIASVTGAVGSVTGNVGGNVTGSVGSVATGGIAAASFAAGAIDATAIATDAIGANELAASAITEIQAGLALEATAQSILTDTAEIGTAGAGLTDINLPNQTMDIVGNITGNLSGSIGSVATSGITAGSIATDAIGAAELAADAVAEIADAVWDEILSGHVVAGSTGEALSAAGGAGDPWITTLPGAYGAGSAGFIVGTNLNATVGSRASQTSVDDLPTNAELAAALAAADDATLAAITALNNLSQANIRTAIGLGSANLDTQLGDLPTNAELATALGTADDAVLAAIAALNNLAAGAAMTLTAGERNAIADAALARSLGTESYAADGAVPTLAQMQFMLYSALAQFGIVTTTLTTRQLDGTTTAMVFTLDNSVTPTSRTRTA